MHNISIHHLVSTDSMAREEGRRRGGPPLHLVRASSAGVRDNPAEVVDEGLRRSVAAEYEVAQPQQRAVLAVLAKVAGFTWSVCAELPGARPAGSRRGEEGIEG